MLGFKKVCRGPMPCAGVTPLGTDCERPQCMGSRAEGVRGKMRRDLPPAWGGLLTRKLKTNKKLK